jgi:hypothetical protein
LFPAVQGTELLLWATLDELSASLEELGGADELLLLLDELDGSTEPLLGAVPEELGETDELDGTTEPLLGTTLEEDGSPVFTLDDESSLEISSLKLDARTSYGLSRSISAQENRNTKTVTVKKHFFIAKTP